MNFKRLPLVTYSRQETSEQWDANAVLSYINVKDIVAPIKDLNSWLSAIVMHVSSFLIDSRA